METLANEPFNGKADLPEIADELSLEVDELFPIVETLQLLPVRGRGARGHPG